MANRVAGKYVHLFSLVTRKSDYHSGSYTGSCIFVKADKLDMPEPLHYLFVHHRT